MSEFYVITDKEKAELLNHFFHSIFTRSSFVFYQYSMEQEPTQTQTLVKITIHASDVCGALTSVNLHKAMGAGGIGPNILSSCVLAIHEPLTHLFSSTFSQETLPKDWLTHCIIPIHKKGDRSLINNHRPISLLSADSKILEHLIYDKITVFLSKLLSSSKIGFRSKYSTVQQLLTMLDSGFDSECQTDCIYLDFIKSFDSVSHEELVPKLRRIGISGFLWKWFKVYLSHKSQFVSISDTSSDTLPVLSGTPHGSILGPLMLLTYINNLHSTSKSSSILSFADDTQCLRRLDCPDGHLLLQHDNMINNWSNKGNLLFDES